MQRIASEEKEKRLKFSINDDIDILSEILNRLDGRSLCAAAAVCRLWRSAADLLWERLCFRNATSIRSIRSIVIALGGFKRLYMLCVRPALSRLGRRRSDSLRRVWTQEEVRFSLSLFCVHCYERDGGLAGDSLRFLCESVNV